MPKEREFELPGLNLAAQEWGEAGQLPVIAAHGWLDNAGSFDLLAPLLSGCHLLAFDAAGHGHSSSRSPDSAYNIWQEVGDLVEIADFMSWERFSVIGHSRGAAVATLVAGTFPDRVERIVLIEGGAPLLGEADQAPENLAKALLDRRQSSRRSGRVFVDRALALAERANGFSKVELRTAEILARRSLRQVEGGFQWHADQRLKADSEFKLTADHMRAFVARITAPALMFIAEKSPFHGLPAHEEMRTLFADFEQILLPGAHHFHLEGAETEIAARTREFLGLIDTA